MFVRLFLALVIAAFASFAVHDLYSHISASIGAAVQVALNASDCSSQCR